MDFESIMNMPAIGQAIAYAIEDGRQSVNQKVF